MTGISVVIPVLNEQAAINATIGHMRRISAGETIEIIVVDGDPEGSTIRAVADPHVLRLTSRPGRAVQMNHGAHEARGDILLFLHADTVLPGGAIGLIRETLESGRWRAGAFGLELDSGRMSLRIVAAAARFRIRLTGIPFGDQSFFIPRDYFHRIGGYAEIPLMEDIEIARRIKRQGGRIAVLQERAVTSSRKWEEEGVMHSIFRNWFLQLSYFAGVSPERLVKLYYPAQKQ
jgi:rSAM/selenodomain-associated transferase 2